jgi:hypothetical protein
VGEKIKFYWTPGRCEVEVNERPDSEAKQSIKEGIVSELLLPVADLKAQWKKKGRKELHSFSQSTKRDRGESYFERYYKNGSSSWFREIKMNCCAFVSINCMRACHSSLKASLSRFNFVSTTECSDRLQTEEHFFFGDCKLYKDQRATMMSILSENRKKNIQNQLQSS